MKTKIFIFLISIVLNASELVDEIADKYKLKHDKLDQLMENKTSDLDSMQLSSIKKYTSEQIDYLKRIEAYQLKKGKKKFVERLTYMRKRLENLLSSPKADFLAVELALNPAKEEKFKKAVAEKIKKDNKKLPADAITDYVKKLMVNDLVHFEGHTYALFKHKLSWQDAKVR